MMPTQKREKLSHVVLYQTNPNNPHAADMIIENAERRLAHIPGISEYCFNKRYDNGRAVRGFHFDVGLNFIFKAQGDKDAVEVCTEYMHNPEHLKFVDFVLDGWMLEGTQATDRRSRKQEFIDNVLYAPPEKKGKWVRDPEAPENEIVWACEQVYDF
jgi:hypothetical protein